MNHCNDNEYIYLSLLHLGAVMWNQSSKRLLRALQYVTSNDRITEGPVKCLYAELATSQKCTYGVIERSLRYAVGRMWQCSGAECSKLLYHSKKVLPCPTVSEFICLYVNAFKRGNIKAWVDKMEESEEHEPIDICEILSML